MRTIPIPALALCLLTPLFALAQGAGPTPDQWVTSSPSFWFWLIAVAIAVVAFIWSNFIVARRGGPHSRRHV